MVARSTSRTSPSTANGSIEAIRACEVWQIGYTGNGIVVGIVDAGILDYHPDLEGQVQPVFGGCSEDRPTFDPIQRCYLEDFHGTHLAGVVAGLRNNGDTGLGENMIGIAYGAMLAEVFLYDDSGGEPNSEQEHAQVIAFKNDCIDVKVHAYDLEGEGGGYSVLPVTVRQALATAVADGRGELGQVFVWSAGNGGTVGERTDYEELVSARQVISVGGVTPDLVQWYNSEPGASLFCAAPGANLVFPSRSYTPPPCAEPPYTPAYSNCSSASGTSYAAPHVAGVIALMQEANSNLAWRDVMEAIVQTAATIDEYDAGTNPDGVEYQANTAGINHAYEYGHGLIDAYEAVQYVTDPSWEPLLCERQIVIPLDPNEMTVGPGQEKQLTVEVDARMRVEHVELLMDIAMVTTGASIGPLEIELHRLQVQTGGNSFGGGSQTTTKSVFTVARNDPALSYSDALFTSVRHWGESGTATWKVIVRNTSNSWTSTWHGAEIRLYGTPKCIADWDMDTDVDPDDLALYDSMYLADDPCADLNGDRQVTGVDSDIFEAEWLSGCF